MFFIPGSSGPESDLPGFGGCPGIPYPIVILEIWLVV